MPREPTRFPAPNPKVGRRDDMEHQVVNVKLEISKTLGYCPSGHITRYRILTEHGNVCAVCLANGNCDSWFEKKGVKA